MKERKPKDAPVPPGEEDDGLATSEDLFGHLVDAPPPPGTGTKNTRNAPVRVRVSDPVSEEAPFRRMRPAAPVEDDEQARRPPARENTGAKFIVTPPKIVVGPGVDLAAVAERAFDEPPGEADRRVLEDTAPPGRPGSWRDDSLGPYRLLDRVAVGGMAEVFKAKRSGVEGFEKIVALKRILPHLSENKEFLTMFVDEAKMVAGLTHPNIVQIFDLGKSDTSYYIAMEYVHGHDLRSIVKRTRNKGLRMPLDLSLRVISQVCSALEYAHRKKDERGQPMEIVHRDVSPQNILIAFEGNVKLADFGIAKAATKASKTERGALRGKLLYMSPEQAWGRTIDHRSDVFSLGIVLYEMVSEHKPFAGADSEATILELVRKCVITPPRAVNPRVPEALDRVIMKALARNPEERYQDAGQMQRGIEKILRERPPVTTRDLARFLELLYDKEEREGSEAARADEPGGDHDSDSFSLDVLLKRFGID